MRHTARRPLMLSCVLVGFVLGTAFAIWLLRAPRASGTTVSPQAGGSGSITCDAPPGQCRVAREAISGVPYPWHILGYELHVQPAPEPWLTGKVAHDQQRIELYVDAATTREQFAQTFAHEIGHTVLRTCGDERLDEWRDRRQLPASVPDHVDPPHDFGSVSEDAAEAFAQYLTGQPSRSEVGEYLSDNWLQRNADLFVLCEDR